MTTMAKHKRVMDRLERRYAEVNGKPGIKRYPSDIDLKGLTPVQHSRRSTDCRPWYFWPALFGAILVACFAYGFFQGDLVKLMVGAL